MPAPEPRSVFEGRTRALSHPPRQVPGGLRAQLLIALVALITLVLAAVTPAIFGFSRRAQLSAASEDARRSTAWLNAELEGSPDRNATLTRALTHLDLSAVGLYPKSGGAVVVGDATLLPPKPHSDRQARILKHRGHTHLVVTQARGSWTLVTARSLGPEQARLEGLQEPLLLIFGLATLVALTLGYAVFTFLIVRPVRALGVSTRRAAQGDLASPVRVLGKNELGQVGHEFNVMLQELERGRAALEEQLQELERAHDQLQRTQDTLVRSEKLASVGHLAAGVAHEVGNPLAAVIGYAELLDEEDPELREEIVVSMRRQLARIHKIIRELVDFSRDDSKEPPSPMPLAPAIEEALGLAGASPACRGVELRVDATARDLPPVLGVPSQVVQVLLNLVLNAAEALCGQEDARVEIGGDVSQARVELWVQDNGPGVPDDVARQIFDPFFTTRPPGEGTGLGLAISLRLMDRFGGELGLAESREQGARFVVSFQHASAWEGGETNLSTRSRPRSLAE